MKRSNQDMRDFMYKKLEAWPKSGQSQREFCKANDISYSVFKYWNRKRKMESCDESDGRRTGKKAFIPLRVQPESFGSAVELIYPNGVRLKCDVDAQKLKVLINLV